MFERGGKAGAPYRLSFELGNEVSAGADNCPGPVPIRSFGFEFVCVIFPTLCAPSGVGWGARNVIGKRMATLLPLFGALDGSARETRLAPILFEGSAKHRKLIISLFFFLGRCFVPGSRKE